MRITVKLLGPLRTYLPEGSGFDDIELEVEAGTTPADLLTRFGIPEETLFMPMIDGDKIADEQMNDPLSDGAELTLVPPIKAG